MSVYVLMRLLESAPQRYERGIRLLSLGRIGALYDRIAGRIRPSDRVLDLGCGTGMLALRAARRGARVTGIDINPQMLDIARQNVREAGLDERVTLLEKGAAELDGEPANHYDAVTAGLVFSELGPDELRYTLEQVRRLLRPGGLLLAAVEARRNSLAGRLLQGLLRLPLVALTWLLTQQSPSRPVADLPRRLAEAGLAIDVWRRHFPGDLVELVARKPPEEGP